MLSLLRVVGFFLVLVSLSLSVASGAPSLASGVPSVASGVHGRKPSKAKQPHFRDVTAEAGLSYLQHEGREAPRCIFFQGSFCEPERMTGGAAVGDVDGDGDLDLFVTRLDASDLLFRNRGDGRFEDASAEAGLDAYVLQSNGAAFADVDDDGDLDLYVSVLGNRGDPVNHRNYLFVNDGSGRFVEAAVARGVDVSSGDDRRGYSIAVGDYDRDGFVDLHVSEWLPFAASHSRLLRNRGSAGPGFFEDVTEAAGVSLQDVDAFGAAFTDLDADGWPDLAVAADFGTSRLFWNQGDGSFVDGTADAAVGTDENGMGSTFGDFDGDGDLDWFVTSIFDPDDTCASTPCNWGASGNRLYRNEGDRRFSDATDEVGVRDGYWGWGAAFFDYDNDGDLDLAMTNGVDFPGFAVDDAYNHDPMRFWENDGKGNMREVSERVGLRDTASGKGLLVFDYDDDGDLDLFVVNNAGQPKLYRNEGGDRRRWLRVQTRGSESNSEGLGARVAIFPRGRSAQVREIGTATHFLGQSERIAHFGLGKRARKVPLVVVSWPSGRVQSFRNVRSNQTLVVTEPSDELSPVVGKCGLIGVEPLLALFAAGVIRRRTRSQVHSGAGNA